MITHVLKLNYLEKLSEGYEEGPRFTLLAGDKEAENLKAMEFTEGVNAETDYLVVEFIATDTNGVDLGPGDLVVLSGDRSSVVISPSEDVVEALVAKVGVSADAAV